MGTASLHPSDKQPEPNTGSFGTLDYITTTAPDAERLGDAAKIAAQDPRKQKHDRRSAEHIYTLMRKNDFPDLEWVPTLGERDLRQLLLHQEHWDQTGRSRYGTPIL